MNSRASINYHDFEIKIERAREGYYRVEADGGPAGQGEHEFKWPFSTEELMEFRRVFSDLDSDRRSEKITDFGERLYSVIFQNDTLVCFTNAKRDYPYLRIKLRLNSAPELLELPWEFLNDGRHFLAIDNATPVIRYLDLRDAQARSMSEPPLRILATISTPRDLPPLVDADDEREKLQSVIDTLPNVNVDFTSDAILNTLEDKLGKAYRQGRPYHVWHYIGHGDFDEQGRSGYLAFCDQHNDPHWVSGKQLGNLFCQYPETLLAYINACKGAQVDYAYLFQGIASAIIQQGVPMVIAMQFRITDEIAAAFSGIFYERLSEGLYVEQAATWARRHIYNLPRHKTEWGTPAFLTRSAPMRLFALSTQDSPTAPIDIDMVPMPAGWVYYDDIRPRVYIGAFCIGVYPVTNQQYKAFLDANPDHSAPGNWENRRIPPGKANHPVVQVSLNDAQAFCDWLSENGNRKWRLPDAMEWTRAGRGDHPDRRRFPWGDDPDPHRCNVRESGHEGAVAVDHYDHCYRDERDSPFGVRDMIGNVWEWTSTPYVSQSNETAYVLKGGGFETSIRDTKHVIGLSLEGHLTPGIKRMRIGFRVACEMD